MPSRDNYHTLDPSAFSFHGFEDLMPEVERTLRDIGIRGGKPKVSIAKDAIYVPSERMPATDRAPGRFVFQGGLVTTHGRPIRAAQSRRRGSRWGARVLGTLPEPAALTVEREIEEEVIYFGWYFGHFGHFLLETLARTWFLTEVAPSVKVVFHTMRQTGPSGTTQRILEAFGVPLDRILILNEPTRLRRVLIPEPLYELSYPAHEKMAEPLRRVASTLVSGEFPSSQPLYLSRRLLPSGLRQIVGEFELEEMLRENGFLIAHPETMAWEDQVRLINRHSNIFTCAGSAAYMVLFALYQPSIHFLTSDIPRRDYFVTPVVAGASAAYCNCLGRGGRPAINTTPLLVEPAKIIDYLETGGFLNKRVRASVAAGGWGMEDRYEEAWLYASIRDIPRGESLPPEVERDAQRVAASSWPVSWSLAIYYRSRNPAMVDALARQFADLIALETDVGRLASYSEEISSKATGFVRRCDPQTSERLASVLADRFRINVETRASFLRSQATRRQQPAPPG